MVGYPAREEILVQNRDSFPVRNQARIIFEDSSLFIKIILESSGIRVIVPFDPLDPARLCINSQLSLSHVCQVAEFQGCR